MSYKKQNFIDGQVLTAAQLNHIEDGVVAAEKAATEAAKIDDSSSTDATWSAKKILEMIAQGGTKDIDLGGKSLANVASIDFGQFLKIDSNPDGMCLYGVDNTDVVIHGVAFGTAENDAINKAQLDKAVKELRIAVDATDNAVQICPPEGVPVKVTAEDLEYSHVKLYCVGKNLFDATATGNMAEGYIFWETGTTSNSDTSLRSAPIPVSHLVGKTLAITGAYVGGKNPGWAFYKDDNTYLSGGNTGTATVPKDAAYFRFTVLKSNITVNGTVDRRLIQLEIGNVVTKVETFREIVFDPNIESVELDRTFLDGVNTFYAYAGDATGGTFNPLKSVKVHVEGYQNPAYEIEKQREEIAQLRNTILAMGANV